MHATPTDTTIKQTVRTTIYKNPYTQDRKKNKTRHRAVPGHKSKILHKSGWAPFKRAVHKNNKIAGSLKLF